MTMRDAHLSPDVSRNAIQLLDHGDTVAIRSGQLPEAKERKRAREDMAWLAQVL